MRARNLGVEEFMIGAIVAGRYNIVEDEAVAWWIASWLDNNVERIGASSPAQDWVRSGHTDTWTFMMALMVSIVQQQHKVRSCEDRMQSLEAEAVVHRLRIDQYDKLTSKNK